MTRTGPSCQRHGPPPGNAAKVVRNREQLANILYRKYFWTSMKYDHRLFIRRFLVPRSLFYRTLNTFTEKNDYFVQNPWCTSVFAISLHHKVMAAVALMAYGACSESVDKNLGLSETTGMACLTRSCNAVFAQFGSHYLQNLSKDHTARISQRRKDVDFPVCWVVWTTESGYGKTI